MKTNRIHCPKRVGLFGGTFNPIHNGHLQAALDVLAQFTLDLIIFIPSALPPHKTEGVLATALDRLEMVRLAIENHPRLDVDDVELNRSGPSYTIDTLRYYKAEWPAESELFFIIGVDAFLEINTWKDYLSLFEEVAFIIMSRPGGKPFSESFESAAETFTRRHIDEEFTLSNHGRTMIHPQYHTIHLARVVPIDIASSRIRQMIRDDEDITRWVDPAVARYIHTKGLYR